MQNQNTLSKTKIQMMLLSEKAEWVQEKGDGGDRKAYFI